jgi:hypothetical protein
VTEAPGHPWAGRDLGEALGGAPDGVPVTDDPIEVVAREVRLRHAPDLRFRIDETFDRMDATRRLFAQEDVRRDVEADRSEDGEGEG